VRIGGGDVLKKIWDLMKFKSSEIVMFDLILLSLGGAHSWLLKKLLAAEALRSNDYNLWHRSW
jgi:hypothetical protein